DGGANGLAGGGLLVLAQAAGEAAAREAAGDAVTGGAPFDGAGELDFACGGVDHAEVDGEVGVLFLASEADALEAQAAAGAGGVGLKRGHGRVDEVLRAGELADLGAGLLANAAGLREVLLFEDFAELGTLDDLELAGRSQLVGEHAGEVASGVGVPPARRRIVGEFSHTDRRLFRAESHRGEDKGCRQEENLSRAHLSPQLDFKTITIRPSGRRGRDFPHQLSDLSRQPARWRRPRCGCGRDVWLSTAPGRRAR